MVPELVAPAKSCMLMMQMERGVGLRPPVKGVTGICGIVAWTCSLPIGRSVVDPVSGVNMTLVLSECRVELGAGGGGCLGAMRGNLCCLGLR
jgi:hypothetical protein